jgi:hypothetical protein
MNGTDADDTDLDAAKAIVTAMQTAYEAGESRLLVVYGHNCTEDGMTKLGEFIDHVLATDDVKILTMSEALDKHGSQMEFGDPAGGTGFAVGPEGTIRARGADFLGGIHVWDTTSMWGRKISLEYYENDLLITSPDTDTDEVRVYAASLRPHLPPYLGGGNTDLGLQTVPWDEVWGKSLWVRSYYGDGYGLQNTYQLASMTSSPQTINCNIPDKSRVVGVRVKVDTAITGASDWSVAFDANGDSAVIGTGLSCVDETEYFFHLDQETTGVTDLIVTAAGATAGVVHAEVWYWGFRT